MTTGHLGYPSRDTEQAIGFESGFQERGPGWRYKCKNLVFWDFLPPHFLFKSVY